jgi:hypothetical protein
LKKDISALSSA